MKREPSALRSGVTFVGADVRAIGDIVEDGDSLAFTIESGGTRAPVKLAFAGRHGTSEGRRRNADGGGEGEGGGGVRQADRHARSL